MTSKTYLEGEVKRLEKILERKNLTETQKKATEQELKFTKIASGSSPSSQGVSVTPASNSSSGGGANIIIDSSGREHIVLDTGEIGHELNVGKGNFITIRGQSGFQEDFKPEMFKGIKQEITPTGIKTTYLSTAGVISSTTTKATEGKIYNVEEIRQQAQKQGLTVYESNGKLIVESMPKYTVEGKNVSPTEAGKTLMERDRILKQQARKKAMVQSFREGIVEKLGGELREEPEPDLETRNLLIEEYKMEVMSGIEQGGFAPQIIGGFATRITPKDPFGLRSLYTVGSGIIKGESADIIKTKLDVITMEGVEWLGGQTLDQAGKIKEPIPYFVDTIPKTSTGQLAISIGAGAVLGAGMEALSPTLGKIPLLTETGKLLTKHPLVLEGIKYGVPIGIESFKVGSMIKKGYQPDEIFGSVGSDILYMGGFSAGFQEGKKIYDTIRTAGTVNIPTEQFIEKEIITGEQTFPSSGKHLSVVDRANVHAEQFLKESPMRLPEGNVIGIHGTNVDLFKGQDFFTVGEGASELKGLYVAPSGSVHFTGIAKNPSIKVFGSNIDDMFGGRPTFYAIEPIGDKVNINLAQKISKGKWELTGPTTEGVIQVSGMKTETEGIFIPKTIIGNPEMKYNIDIWGRKIPIVTAQATGGIGSIPDININPLKAGTVSLSEELGLSKSVSLLSPESGIAVSLSNIEGRPTSSSKGVDSLRISSPTISSPKTPSIGLSLSGLPSSFESSGPSSPSPIIDIKSPTRTVSSPSVSIPSLSLSQSVVLPSMSYSPISTFSFESPISEPSTPPSIEYFGRRKGKRSEGIRSWNFNINLGYGPDLGSLLVGRKGSPSPDKIFSGVEMRPIPIPKFKGVSL